MEYRTRYRFGYGEVFKFSIKVVFFSFRIRSGLLWSKCNVEMSIWSGVQKKALNCNINLQVIDIEMEIEAMEVNHVIMEERI